MTQGWKVGELSAATGLTVRTLHHWDELGLVTPSARTSAGHRRYDEADARRTYEVVALRELGLPLEAIAGVLDGDGLDLAEVLAAHVDHLRRRLASLRTVETTVSAVLARVRTTGSARPSELLEMINEVSTMTETFRQYFTPDQLAALQERRERLGDDHFTAVADEWPTLIGKVQAAMDAGIDPATPEVRALARRWTELLEAFDGGDPALRAANTRMRAENPEEVRAAGGPSDAMIDFVRRAGESEHY